jgi:signal transduction histidine kinase
MKFTNLDLERSIARGRIFLALVALVVLYLDPMNDGMFGIGLYPAMVLAIHFAYSVSLWFALRPSHHLARIATVGDVVFVVAVAAVTNRATSPFGMFFCFAVLSVGIRSGFYSAMVVTLLSVALYALIVVMHAPDAQILPLTMRCVYFTVTGCVIAYLANERLKQDAVIRRLEANAERARIARSLHDGYAAALAGVNLRLETCRELSRRGMHEKALAEMTDLQKGVNREHDELRAYIRSLLQIDPSAGSTDSEHGASVAVQAELRGSAALVEHVLSIMLEGTRNIRRHASARSASIAARMAGGDLMISIDDDGVGFHADAVPPWSIVSRVSECGGEVTLPRDGRPGGHLLVQLPAA